VRLPLAHLLYWLGWLAALTCRPGLPLVAAHGNARPTIQACFQTSLPTARWPLQAPQWVLSAANEELLLMAVVHPDPPAGAADDSGTLVLASLDAVSHAYEAEGSRLSPSLLLSLSREVRAVREQGGWAVAKARKVSVGAAVSCRPCHPCAHCQPLLYRWRPSQAHASSALQPTATPA